MKGEPAHILARPGDLAEKVIVAGDPGRINQLAEMLEDVRLVSDNRGFNVYTGRYRDVALSLACHGIGGPSSAIVFEELKMLGAKVIVRLGTAGGLRKEVELGDVVIPNVACYYLGSGTISAYAPRMAPPTAPSFDVLESLVTSARKSALRFWIGPVVSSDAYYAEDDSFVMDWTRVGALAVEMECATLFALGYMRGIKTGAVLVVTDNLAERKRARSREDVKKWVESAAKIVLEALRDIEA